MTTPLRIALSIALVTVVVTLVSATPTIGAVPPCRVRNLTQDTGGDSLIRMTGAAVDGDRLRVRGTCPGEIVIRADIVITGVGDRPTLTGRERTRVVRVGRGATVTLRKLRIRRGEGEYKAGGILNEGRLTLGAVLVEGNTARTPPISIPSFGGGIVNEGVMRLMSSTVRGNEAKGSAGGIANGGRMVIKRSVIAGNATRVPQHDPYGGGGIESWGRLWLFDSRVVRNDSAERGGGIYVAGGRATVVRSTIARNQGDLAGGLYNEGHLVVRDSTIADNGVGGIDNMTTLTLVASTVTGNRGSGIFSVDHLEVRDSTIARNRGSGISNSGTLTLVGSSVRGNTAKGDGGGIANGGRLAVRDSTIANNSSDGGGGLFNGRTATMEGTIVRGNRSRAEGGGISNSGNLTLVGSSVRRNTAADAGGGIFSDVGTVSIDRASSVSANTPDDCVGTPGC